MPRAQKNFSAKARAASDALNQAGTKKAKPIIWDTDWWTDVDDVVAARVLVWAERSGLVDIMCIGISAVAATSAPSLDAFLIGEGRRGMTIGVDFDATDYGGPSPYHTNMLSSLHDYNSNSDAEEIVRMYRRALATSKQKVDIIAVGYPQAVANLLKSAADDISPLNGLQLVAAKVDRLWMMAGNYPNGSENNFTRNARSRTAGAYLCANWPTSITFLGWEVGNPVSTGGNLASYAPAASDMLTRALADHGSATGRPSWDPMLTLLACYGDTTMAGYSTVKGTNVVDPSTGANIFTAGAGNHEYVVKLRPDAWYVREINSILERRSWPYRQVGGQQLARIGGPADTTPPTVTASLAAGSYSSAQTVTLTTEAGATIYYTVDGSTPTASSSVYSAALNFSTTTTLKFFAKDLAGNASAVQSITYTINIVAFDPTANLFARWLASDLSANADGASISTWTDKSGGGRTLTSPSSGENPVFKAAKNGKAAVQFTGGATPPKLLTGNVTAPDTMTVYMRVLFDAAPTGNQTIMGQDGGVSNRMWHETADATSFKGVGFITSGGTTGLVDQQSGSIVAGNWHTFVGKYTPTSIEAFFDGVSNGATTFAARNTGTAEKITVGGTYSGSNWAEAFVGYVTEIRIYTTAHTNSDISTVIAQMV